MQYLQFVLTLYLALVLLASGAAKLIAVQNFGLVLQRQAIIPRRLIPSVARLTPPLEAILAFLIFVPITSAAASFATLTTLASFTLVTVVLVWQGRDAECGCFGLLYRERMNGTTVMRDLTLTAVAGVVVILNWNRPVEGALRMSALASLACIGLLVALPSAVVPLRRRLVTETPDQWVPGAAETSPDHEST